MSDPTPASVADGSEAIVAPLSRRKKLVFTCVAVLAGLAVLEGIAAIVLGVLPDLRYLEHKRTFRLVGQADIADRVSRTDPDLFWRLQPDVVLPTGDDLPYQGRVSNALAVRSRPHPFKKPPGTFRILCLGDSCTFGFGCDFDETYPLRLETALNADGRTPRVEVINAGVPGYSTFQGLVYLGTEGRRYQPDVVTIWFEFNDQSNWDNQTDSQHAGVLSPGPVRAVLEHSRLYQLLSYTLRRKARPKLFEGRVPRAPVADYARLIEKMVETARQIGATPVLVVAPNRSDVYNDREEPPTQPPSHRLKYSRYGRAVMEVARRTDAPLLNLPRIMRENWREARFLDTCHPAREGHALIARELAALLARHNLPPRPGT